MRPTDKQRGVVRIVSNSRDTRSDNLKVRKVSEWCKQDPVWI